MDGEGRGTGKGEWMVYSLFRIGQVEMQLFVLSGQGLLKASGPVLGLITLFVLSLGQISANGVHAGSQEVYSGPSGSYEIRVMATSVVGIVHMTIFVAPSGDTAP